MDRYFPESLKERRQWITWRLENGNKIPNGKSNDASTWTAFEDIQSSDKVAYVFSSDDPFVGIDLDNCLNEAGEPNELALEVLRIFEGVAFAEVSQSGRGLHLIVRGKKTEWSVCKRGAVECYEHSRFWVMSGNWLDGWNREPQEAQQQLDDFLGRYLSKSAPKVAVMPTLLAKSNLRERMQSYVDHIPGMGEGGRNQRLFGIAGHLWAMIGDDGQGPTLEDVRDCCQAWNMRCNPPLDDGELIKTINNGRDKGSPRDAKLPGVTAVNQADAIEGGEIAERLWPTKRSEAASETEDSDEDFCLAMLPEDGLLRMAYDYYWSQSLNPSPIMGLAIAVSLVEVLLGRKVATHTDLRSNDYNLVIAATSTGKEACKKTITRILDAAGAAELLMAADVQSGNGLITALVNQPCSIWIGDEFGKVLQGILDKKGNQHLKNIGKHLLSLYGESNGRFLGAAHAAGSKNVIDQPHLCILGLSTGSTIFDGVTDAHVSDGLMNRIAFWPVQERPPRKRKYRTSEVPDELASLVAQWFQFVPGMEAKTFAGSLDKTLSELNPKAVQMSITPDAEERWDEHAFAIDEKMNRESSQRSAMWGRTAARSLLLAMVHRCSRMPSPLHVATQPIEMQDVNWGIRLSNWLSRVACDLVEQNMVDKSLSLASKVLSALEVDGIVYARDAMRSCRSLSSGDLDAAAIKLGFTIAQIPSRTRAKKAYVRGSK